jgi:hypothetical protein
MCFFYFKINVGLPLMLFVFFMFFMVFLVDFRSGAPRRLFKKYDKITYFYENLTFLI